MTIKISQKGEFYAINVSETMTAEETILVFADTEDEARKLARKNVNFGYDDFESEGMITFVTKKSPPVDSLHVYDYILVGDVEYPVEEFLQEFQDSEEWERRRIADLEKNNGQLALTL